jgi:hypothetical protein
MLDPVERLPVGSDKCTGNGIFLIGTIRSLHPRAHPKASRLADADLPPIAITWSIRRVSCTVERNSLTLIANE